MFCISSSQRREVSVFCSASLLVRLVEVLGVIVGELAAEECSSIVIVVSPLISLMKDQVVKFNERGLYSLYLRRRRTERHDYNFERSVRLPLQNF